MGFFIGASVLTLAELLDLGVRCAVLASRRLWRGKVKVTAHSRPRGGVRDADLTGKAVKVGG